VCYCGYDDEDDFEAETPDKIVNKMEEIKQDIQLTDEQKSAMFAEMIGDNDRLAEIGREILGIEPEKQEKEYYKPELVQEFVTLDQLLAK
jgi:hypothetical protein